MRCFEIIAVPPGDLAPLAVREKWVGLTLPLQGYESSFTCDVHAMTAVEILKLTQPDAARFWQHDAGFDLRGVVFNFHPDVCKVVDGLPSLGFSEADNPEITVADFFAELETDHSNVLVDLEYEVGQAHWENFKKFPLSRPALIVAVEAVQTAIWCYLEGCTTEAKFDRRTKEGHAFYKAVYDLNESYALGLSEAELNRPLSITDFAMMSGIIEHAGDGNVRLTVEAQKRAASDSKMLNAHNN